MDFSLSEEQQDVQNLARQILADYTENEQLKRIDEDEALFLLETDKITMTVTAEAAGRLEMHCGILKVEKSDL